MENTIKLLATIAEELDNQGLSSAADRVDAVANKVLDIKTAQYVGIQGYWIRNSRCWSNCYRKKRTESPTKAAQQVWTECHEEYVDSINDDNATWNKYAEGDSLVKTASVELKKEFANSDAKLVASIKTKIAAGYDHGTAVFSSIEENSNSSYDGLIASSNEILDIATDLIATPDIAIKLAEAAETLVKEAGPMDFFKGLGQGVKNWAGEQSFIGQLSGMKAQISRTVANFDQSWNACSQALATVKQLFATTQQTLQQVQQNPQSTPKQKQYAASALQAIGVVNNTNPTDMKAFRQSLPKAIEALDGVLRGNMNAPTQAPQAAPTPTATAPSAPPTATAPSATPPPLPGTPPPLPSSATSPSAASPTPSPAATPATPTPPTSPAAKPTNRSRVVVPPGLVNKQLQVLFPSTLESVYRHLRSNPTVASTKESYFKLAAADPLSGIGETMNPLDMAIPGMGSADPKITPLSTEKVVQKTLRKLSPETIEFLKGLDEEQFGNLLDYYKRKHGLTNGSSGG